jgi:hypothetical protein
MYKLPLLLATGAVIVFIVATARAGAPRSETFGLRAALNARQEVPRQAMKVAAANGSFVGTLTQTGSRRTITWKLVFSHLSGAARQAHIHYGKAGKAGPIAVTLCGPCKSGMHAMVRVPAKLVRAIEAGRTYVNVHTKNNPNGEIRGQIKAVKGY